MADTNPLKVQHPGDVQRLIRALSGADRTPYREIHCKRTTFQVEGTSASVDSWKIQDHDYRHPDLPTYARGLFTAGANTPNPKIVTRGYDKFFNVNEANETQWRNIENGTEGPYELSVKENGCIIFISGLEDDHLLVCSKHSTGRRTDELSHAVAGEQWVERHVKAVGRSLISLARELYENNLTAVGELCDDSFEEHVLAYDPDASGIYIHGLNYNLPKFATLSGEEVHRFADRWGFKKAKFVTFNRIDAVQQFLEECAETGTWDGRETEGFVVRCKRRTDIASAKAGENWFFKYKFEEPYLMYRQWRECTKAVIADKHPKIRKHQKITEEYLQFARRQFVENPHLAEEYKMNHGIIALRDKFLASRGLNGAEIIALEASETRATGKETEKYVVLVPIATLGCGKTTVALALTHLFKWDHVQNDSIAKQKDKPGKFAFEVSTRMSNSPVVIADRNNHQRRERAHLMDNISPVITQAQYVALHWVHEPKNVLLPDIRDVTRRRVLERGDNHQTIRAGSKSQGEIMGIMDGFLKRFEGVDISREPDSKFDHIIDLDVCADSRANLETIVMALHKAYPKIIPEMPTAEMMDLAIEYAMKDYEVKEDLSAGYSKKQKKGPAQKTKQLAPEKSLTPASLAQKIEFMQISVNASDIRAILHEVFAPNNAPPEAPPDFSRMYDELVQRRRIQSAFHVTLIHRSVKEVHPHIWQHYERQYIDELTMKPVPDPVGRPPVLGNARVRLERLVWDDRVMAFVVRILFPEDNESSYKNVDFDTDTFPCANLLPHITVGTASADIKPKESNDLMKNWLMGDHEELGIHEVEFDAFKIIEGKMGPVMMRGKY